MSNEKKRGNAEWRALTRRASLKPIEHIKQAMWEAKNIPDPGEYKEAPRKVYKLRVTKTTPTALETPILEEYKAIGREEKLEVIARRLGLECEHVGKRARNLTYKGLLVKLKRGVYAAV